jgi:YaiO family outer membrane protein
VQRPSFTAAALLAVLVSTAASQGEPEPRAKAPVTTVGVDYRYTTFNGAQDPWHLAALSFGARNARGTFIGRVNLAEHFAIIGAQYEVDAYPLLGEGKYAYLNAAYSRAAIFPQQRYGAEIFTTLPREYEASLGVRNLRFATDQVTLLTGSVARHTRNYSVWVRPYVRQESGGLSASSFLTARRYYEDADTYLGVRIGAGNAPTETLEPSQLGRESSWTVGLHASRPASTRAITTWRVSYERDNNPSQKLNRLEFGAGLKMLF